MGMGLTLPLFTQVVSACFPPSPPQTHLLTNGETEAEWLGAHPGLNPAHVVMPHASNSFMEAETGRKPQYWPPKWAVAQEVTVKPD